MLMLFSHVNLGFLEFLDSYSQDFYIKKDILDTQMSSFDYLST